MDKMKPLKTKIQPFVAWAGGKTQLLSEIKQEISRAGKFETYYEPFVGGGAVFFDLLPQKAIINDDNHELINTYRIIRDNPNELISELKKYQNTAKDFYCIRAWDRKPDYFKLSNVKKAARFIFLNKTCFNALYRVNHKGYFNSAYGKREKVQIVQESNLRRISRYLNMNDIKFYAGDFMHVLENIQPNSLIYLDPPYMPITDTANFTRYTKQQFKANDQRRLATKCYELDKEGEKLIISNSDTQVIRELYCNFFFNPVKAKRRISAKSSKRDSAAEVLITNF